MYLIMQEIYCRQKCRRLSNNRIINNICYCFFVMSVLADNITAEIGIPSLSVKICLFVWPSLLLLVGFFSVISLLRRLYWYAIYGCHHVHLIPLILSYSLIILIHRFLNISGLILLGTFCDRLNPNQIERAVFSIGTLEHLECDPLLF